MDDATFAQVAEAFQEHSVLVFHDQRLTDDEQMAFSRRFGPLEETIKAPGKENRYHRNLVDLSNVDPDQDGRLIDWTDRRMIYQSGNQLWHTDSSFKPVPAMASMLSAREVPPVGGETEFASMRHAYATLPAEVRARLEGAVAVHSILYSRHTIAPNLFDPDQADALPPVRQALVRANPVNGRRSIFVGSHAWYVEGLAYAESRRLLDDLLAHTTRPELVYQHRWRPWDLVMWDNRCVLHRGRPWDAARHKRVMHRTTVAGDGPTAEPPLARRAPQWDGIIPEGVGA
jgi:alpha-ketoglutarate-dependent 2,4-dichlorophenoxyacetate dioxygenase